MMHGVRGDLSDSLRSAHFATLVDGAYHGPPLSGSPLLVCQQKNSPPTKNPPTSPSWIPANFEAIRKPKQAISRDLNYLRNTRFFSKAARPQGACWQLR